MGRVSAERAVADAAAWLLRRRNGLTPAEERQFAGWLAADEAHRIAFEHCMRGWEVAGLAADQPEMLRLRRQALMVRPRAMPRAPIAAGLAALAFLGVLSVGILAPPGPSPPAQPAFNAGRPSIYRTAVGERSTVRLADGSLVTLDTDSRLEVSYSRSRRALTLLAGQALFQVAHNPARPFVVTALDRQVIAVGTQFNVRIEQKAVRVALIQGRVLVRRAGGSPERVAPTAERLAPGEQLLAQIGGPARIAPADLSAVTSWREGRLRFDDTPLAEAAAEMNRYSNVPIIVEDSRTAAIRVSGAFSTGRSREFAAAVGGLFPVRVSETGGAIRLRRSG